MVTLRNRAMYGIGGAVYAAKEAAYTMFVLLYFTQVLGLSWTLTGIVVAISLVWDAVSDPMVGAWSDRFRSSFGRRRPFMIAAVVPSGLGFVGLFAPPDWVVDSTTALACWLLFWSLWVRTAVTFFSIPHLAQSVDMTRDYYQRSKVLGARMAVIFCVSVLLPAVALITVFAETNGVDGRFVADRYLYYGLMSCFLVWVAGGVSCCLVPTEQPLVVVKRSMLAAFLDTFSNRNFRFLLGYDIAATMSYGVIVSLNMLAWIYFWEFSAGQISLILAFPSLVSIVAVMFTLDFWIQRFEKAQILRIAIGAMLLNGLWLYPGRMLDLLPGNDSSITLWLNVIFMLVFMYFFLLRAISSQSIAADIADEHDLQIGQRQEGGFFAALNFSNKIAFVLGPAYGGVVLDIIGLNKAMSPGLVPQEILDGLASWYMLGAGAPLIIAVLMANGIRLSQNRVREIQQQLADRATSDSQSAL